MSVNPFEAQSRPRVFATSPRAPDKAARGRRGASRASTYARAIAGLIVAGLIYAASAREDAPQNAEIRFFDIPAQPLASALQAYGQTTKAQVLYESRLAAGRRSAPLRGDFTPEEALTALLAGTEIKVRRIGSDAITLVLASDSGDLPPPHFFAPADLSLDPLRVQPTPDEEEQERIEAYSEIVRSDVAGALRRNARTRSGNYRVGVDLWVDEARKIRHTRLFRSTGDVERDAAVTATLQGLVISRDAPDNMPLPLHVVVVVTSLK